MGGLYGGWVFTVGGSIQWGFIRWVGLYGRGLYIVGSLYGGGLYGGWVYTVGLFDGGSIW